MRYAVKIKAFTLIPKQKDVVVSVIPETLREAGEIYYSVFDGSAEIVVDAENAEKAIESAKEMYERKVKR